MEHRFIKNPTMRVKAFPNRIDKLPKKGKGKAIAIWNDLFHKDVDEETIKWVVGRMYDFPQHQFFVLTKRPMRAGVFFSHIDQPANLWIGTTIESQRYMDRLDKFMGLKRVFVSFEPLLGEIIIPPYNAKNMDWMIIGCESGRPRRTTDCKWIVSLIAQAEKYRIPFYLKQIEDCGKVIKAPIWNGFPRLGIPRGLRHEN
jgi:protein gp37